MKNKSVKGMQALMSAFAMAGFSNPSMFTPMGGRKYNGHYKYSFSMAEKLKLKTLVPGSKEKKAYVKQLKAKYQGPQNLP